MRGMTNFIVRAWVEAANEQATAAEIHPSLLLGGCRKHKVARARWHAFKQVLDANPRLSVKRLADTAGFDHTAVLYGLRRLSGASTHDIRTAGVASGRKPVTARTPAMEAAE